MPPRPGIRVDTVSLSETVVLVQAGLVVGVESFPVLRLMDYADFTGLYVLNSSRELQGFHGIECVIPTWVMNVYHYHLSDVYPSHNIVQ